MPHAGVSWQPRGRPATQPHEYIRGGTTKILTLFHPATGQVRLQSAARCTNAVLHPWLRERLSAILAELPPPVPRSGGPRCGPPSASRLDTFGMVLPTLSGCKPSRALRPRKPDGRGVTVVGDDAQSIYSFRAAEHAIASRCRLAIAEAPALTLWHCAGREREIGQ